MKSKNIFMSHGDLTADYVYTYSTEDSLPILTDKKGGGCNWNVLHHLANMGETCYAFGSKGDDEAGTIAESSLKEVGINTNNIIVESKPTNIVNLIYDKYRHTFTDTRYSPVSNACTVTFSENLPKYIPTDLADNNIYIILSRMRPINLEFIRNIANKKCCLDIGSFGTISEFDAKYLLDFLKEIDILLLNGMITPTLLKTLNLQNLDELFDSLNLDLLIETNDKNPVTFIYKKDNLRIKRIKKPDIIDTPIDPVGAGDAFFSVIIKSYSRYVAQQQPIDNHFIDIAFALANNFSKKIVQTNGCRLDRSSMREWVSKLPTNLGYSKNNLIIREH